MASEAGEVNCFGLVMVETIFLRRGGIPFVGLDG